MKKRAHYLLMFLVVMVLLSTVITPASAALSNTMKTKFTRFPRLTIGAEGKFVKALQIFLIYDAASTSTDLVKYGLDGGLGDTTFAAIVKFQKSRFPGQDNMHDGVVGPNTWGAIADSLYAGQANSNYLLPLRNADHVPIYQVYAGSSDFTYWYYNTNHSVGEIFYME